MSGDGKSGQNYDNKQTDYYKQKFVIFAKERRKMGFWEADDSIGIELPNPIQGPRFGLEVTFLMLGSGWVVRNGYGLSFDGRAWVNKILQKKVLDEKLFI